jgi:hypothetical protein
MGLAERRSSGGGNRGDAALNGIPVVPERGYPAPNII